MKAVLASIRPKWCYFIFEIIGKDFKNRPRRKKRLELRKSAPELNEPFKVYIYCTLQGSNELFKMLKNRFGEYEALSKWNRENWGINKGKVIGEFTCDYVLRHCEMGNADIAEEQSCVLREDILKYSNGKEVFGWHISDLIIYDKPKEISEFYRKCEKMPCESCEHFKYQGVNSDEYDYDCEFLGGRIPITRPPQSWMYCESEVVA